MIIWIKERDREQSANCGILLLLTVLNFFLSNSALLIQLVIKK